MLFATITLQRTKEWKQSGKSPAGGAATTSEDHPTEASGAYTFKWTPGGDESTCNKDASEKKSYVRPLSHTRSKCIQSSVDNDTKHIQTHSLLPHALPLFLWYNFSSRPVEAREGLE
jgi:hypothetical protein